ncbi:hypothetical protein P3X46_015534 [Hevea brasiliensis]|uniref:C3H1-type domain-containing protein n=1 Tax=Hevea brasiliensis TaxID=3981 RepID=A0ABQ9LXL4_HEVBR|nr:zinc finger CCCH domain-containing protein 65 [Hevea brasiliensis]KAJ9172278.1 hypothetical protein P3X46_015534 [Hevea brasiliensis]
MEKPQSETPKSLFHFRPHHKSHLKSETYYTLVRILSQCHNHPELCELSRIVPQELKSDNHSNEPGKASEVVTGMDQIDSLTQNIVLGNENFDPAGFRDGLCDTKAVIDEIENFMRIEEDEDPSKQRDLPVAVNDDTNETGLQDKGFGQLQRLLMDELEDVMKGNKEVVHDNVCNFATTSLDESQNGSAVGTFSNNQEAHLDLQPIFMEGCGGVGRLHIDKEHSTQNTFATIDSSLDKIVTYEVSKLSDNHEDKSSSMRNNQLEASHEMRQKEMESGKSVCTIGAVGSSDHMIEDGEMEEGEISGEFQVCGRLVDTPSEDVVGPQEQKQLSEDVTDRNKFPLNDKKEANKKDSGSSFITLEMVDNMIDTRKVETKDVGDKMASKRKVIAYGDPILVEELGGYKKQKKICETKELKKGSGVKGKKKGKNSAPYAKSGDQIAIVSQENACKEKLKQDAGLRNKKKRGPPSEERKAKKKEKKRKKRAQKNRELGVKRLKLRPVQNPKPLVFCRHYIKGRCQEGENCKFSHDTIPLTKSKPCCHFARHSCLKGDDCPFDHQLSKYPCTNYVSTGSCSRGEDCMFSHKLPLKEDLPSASNVSTPDLKPQSLPGTSNSKKQLDSDGTSHHNAKASPDTVGVSSCKNTEHNVAKSVVNPPVLVPKGITFLSAGKSSVAESSHSVPGSSSLTRNEEFKVGNKTDRSASGSIQNSNEIPRGTPAAVPPKGINFLSFGKAPWEFSSVKKLTSNNGAKLSLSNNVDLTKQSSSPLHTSNSIQVGKESRQSVSNTPPWLNKMLQVSKFAAVPLKSNILSSGESSTDGSRSNSLGSSSSNSASYVDRSVQASAVAPEKPSAIPPGLSASAHGSGPSADHLEHPWLKNTPKSAQKAFLSTLAFAAKVESEMKIKQSSIGTLAVSSRAIKETGDSVQP